MAAYYLRLGFVVAAQRWRGQAGEIDLIMRDGPLLIFVEVKRAQSFAIAAERISSQQMSRIMAAASEFVAQEPGGQDSEMRFDAALVDGTGQIEIRENVVGW